MPDEFGEDVAGIENSGCVAHLFLDESPGLSLFLTYPIDLSVRQQCDACNSFDEISLLLEHSSGP